MTEETSARAALWRDRNFRWLAGGGIISMLGDQFTMIALPWLVLKMTGDPLALGAVMAVMSVPRAVFMLVGGALVDRYSPRQVLMLTKVASTVLLGALGLLVLGDAATMPLVYLFAIALGLATAFSMPAGSSIMPRAISPALLNGANGMLMGMRQITMLAGPLLAGLLIAVFDTGSHGSVQDAGGLGIAFLLDAASFAFSAWTLAKVNVVDAPAPATATAGGKRPPLFGAIAEGLRYCWNDADLRTCFGYWGLIALLIAGPLQVAMPLLAAKVGGAAAFGSLMGAHGAGALAGMVLSGVKPGLRIRNLGTTLLAIDALIGLLFMPLGHIHAAWQGMQLLLLVGLLGGYLQVTVYTWLQRQIPAAMLGRGMAVFMFLMMGLAPVSAAATGWLMRALTIDQLFAGCGMTLVALAGLAFTTSRMRRISEA